MRPQYLDIEVPSITSAITRSVDFAEAEEHAEAGQTTALGFWIYLMSDCILFSALFATYAVLRNAVAGGPAGAELFHLPYVLIETLCLLVSSITYGMVMLALKAQKRRAVLGWLLITAVLGACFITMEVHEFSHMIGEGAGPDRSAFLSSFFTLVGTHGLHVSAGLIWMLVMMIQVARTGLTSTNASRLLCLSLFWHFLDIVWIGVFTIVYLMGVIV
ncbi:MAG: cytochrome o ubiquinol oxidase subunit III [Steroidobacteraceae bacterium]